MQINDIFLESYSQARKTVKNLLGTTPEDYKVLLFVDPSLYQSVLLKTLKTGTPKAAISSTELDIFRDLKEKKFLPDAIDLFYPGRNPRIYFPSDRIDNQLTQEVMEAKLVQQLAKAVLCENTISRFPDVLNTLFRQDTIIYELFTNNVYEFVLERGASWVWQYFQDFTAVYRLLSLYNLDQFYVPPNTIRSASVFYNYLMEIKDITQKRSQTVLKAPLYDLILNGFAEIVLETHLQSYNDDELEKILTGLKANLGQPTGVIGKLFLEQRGDDLKSIYSEAINLKNDQELTSIWGRSETKEKMAEVRENLSNRALIWHASKSSYWSDLWPLRASQFDKIDSYVGKIQRRGYKSFSELLNDSPQVSSHGRVKLKDREVVVLSVNEDTIGQEQLILLRNHLQAQKESFSTPLPGLPDVIVFKKYSGMHVASYLGVVDSERDKRYPSSPYDLPVVVRAIQVTRKRDAYISTEREEDGKLDVANYDNLHKLTEPQHRAVRYLIRQKEVLQ